MARLGGSRVAPVQSSARRSQRDREANAALSDLIAGVRPHAPVADEVFLNPLYDGADPWVIRHDNQYFSCHAQANGAIEIWRSDSPVVRGGRKIVWRPPASGWNRTEVWAPELHRIRGQWFIYYAASDGHNRTHRMGVLVALTDDPQGPYRDVGMLYTGDEVGTGRHNRWAIDGTVLDLRGQLYFIWSGWEGDADVQHLYIAPMSDPCTISGNRVRLCDNDTYDWERVGENAGGRGLNEGPIPLVRNGRVMIVYSASASWQTTYKLGLLHMRATSDPLNPASWQKEEKPAFESSDEVVGVGHCCFTTSPDGSEDWMIYHAKRSARDGWDRIVRAQPIGWKSNGLPDLGEPVANDQLIAAPSRGRTTTLPMPNRAA